jgi:hypothetical protein
MQIAPARRTQAAKSQKIRPLTEAGQRLRAEKAKSIADLWISHPRRTGTVDAIQYCSRNGGVAAAVVLVIHNEHGVKAALAFAKQVSAYGRSNSDTAKN